MEIIRILSLMYVPVIVGQNRADILIKTHVLYNKQVIYLNKRCLVLSLFCQLHLKKINEILAKH